MGSTNVWTPKSIQRLLADVITHVTVTSMKDVILVLEAGADPNGSVVKGLKPLHYAVYENHLECVELLLQRGADPNKPDSIGYTPLHIACKHGHYDCAKLLLEHGAAVNFCDENDKNVAEVSRTLANLTENPMSLAIENNNSECLQLLLQHGANPNQEYFLGYELNLVPSESVRCLDVLLRHGSNPNVFSRGGTTPLMKACKMQKIEAVKTLLHHGADVNIQCPPKFDQKRALHFAVMSGNSDIVRVLLKAGADTKKPPNYKFAPLDFAITQDKIEVCKVLLEHGADPNESNGENTSPLQVACSSLGLKHQRCIIEVLLQHGGDPNFSSPKFSYIAPSLCPILEYLSYADQYEAGIFKLLLEYGARVNISMATRIFRIKDPMGILTHVRKLRPYEGILHMLIEAAGSFQLEAICKETTLSNWQKELLMQAGSMPIRLKCLARLAVRKSVHLPMPPNIESLPLPSYIKSFLVFDML